MQLAAYEDLVAKDLTDWNVNRRENRLSQGKKKVSVFEKLIQLMQNHYQFRRRRFNGENQLDAQTTSLGNDDPESGDPLIGIDGSQLKPKGVKQTVVALFQNGK